MPGGRGGGRSPAGGRSPGVDAGRDDPSKHAAPDGRWLSELTQQQAAALLEVSGVCSCLSMLVQRSQPTTVFLAMSAIIGAIKVAKGRPVKARCVRWPPPLGAHPAACGGITGDQESPQGSRHLLCWMACRPRRPPVFKAHPATCSGVTGGERLQHNGSALLTAGRCEHRR